MNTDATGNYHVYYTDRHYADYRNSTTSTTSTTGTYYRSIAPYNTRDTYYRETSKLTTASTCQQQRSFVTKPAKTVLLHAIGKDQEE